MKENWSRLWLVLNVELWQIHCNNDPPVQDGIQWCNDPGTNMIKHLYTHIYINKYIYIAVGFSNRPYTHTVIILTDTSRLIRTSWYLPIFQSQRIPVSNEFVGPVGFFFHTLWSFTGYYFGLPPADSSIWVTKPQESPSKAMDGLGSQKKPGFHGQVVRSCRVWLAVDIEVCAHMYEGKI